MRKGGTEAANAELEKVNEEENAEFGEEEKERECELNKIKRVR